jgi:uncharacterized protein
MTTTSSSRPLALVTGASSGIGLELARELQARGHDLLVSAEDAELELAAASLGDGVQAVRADLGTAGGVEQLWAAVTATGRPLAVACLNAGVGRGGPFVENPLADELHLVALNVTGTLHLAKRVVQDMVPRGSGRLMFTSSIASTMPGPYQAVYNASKSFVQSLSEALTEELKGTGVTVTTLMPGPVETPFWARAQLLDTALGKAPKDDAAAVAKQGVDALLKGERKVVAASLTTKLQAAVNGVLPDAVKAIGHAVGARPRG